MIDALGTKAMVALGAKDESHIMTTLYLAGRLFMTYEGRGRVTGENGFISVVRYRVAMEQKFTDSGTPNYKRITLDFPERSAEIPLSITAFTLEMEDEQALSFFVRSQGVFEPTGGIRGGK